MASNPPAALDEPDSARSGVSRSPQGRPPKGPRRFRLRRTGLPQTVILLRFLLAAGWDAARGALGDLRVGAVRRADRRAARERRQAERAVRTLGELKGAFVKAGQFAASRHDLLPESWLGALAQLRDRVPPLPLSAVQGVVEAELGGPLARHFPHFEAEALAAASIAQVHRARLPDGREVAVKIQYPWLADSLRADLSLLALALRLAAILRGRRLPDRRRVFQEFSAGLAEELDFAREARVAAEIAANLAEQPRVVVPEVVASHSSTRLLTTSYHEALRVTDAPALARHGVSAAEVMEILARAYAKQVFVDGLFHADPHPGNLGVLVDESAAPRLLFLDFGLSKRLPPELRHEMRLGLFALLRQDLEGFLAGMQRMHMIQDGAREGVAAAVSAMFERLRGEARAPLALAGDRVLALKDEAKVLLQETPGLQLPNDLLLYARTLAYLFSLGREIAPEVDVMKLSLPYLLQFLADRSESALRPSAAADPAGG